MERLNKEGLAYYHSLLKGLSQRELADVVGMLSDKIDNIEFPETDLTEVAKESTLLAESAAIKRAIADATPEVDLSEVAKQGENTEATNTAILAEIKAINDLKNIYSVRFEQNQDGDNTYTMVLPLVAGIVGDTIVM